MTGHPPPVSLRDVGLLVSPEACAPDPPKLSYVGCPLCGTESALWGIGPDAHFQGASILLEDLFGSGPGLEVTQEDLEPELLL